MASGELFASTHHAPRTTPNCVKRHHQQRVISNLDVAGEYLATEGQATQYGDGQGVTPFAGGGAPDDEFDAGQEQGQPRGRGDNHREYGRAHQHETTALVHQSGQEGTTPPQTPYPRQHISQHPRQPQLAHRKPAIRLCQGQNQKQKAEWVVGQVLAFGQERRARQDGGIPQGKFPLFQTLADELPPVIVL